MRAETALVDRRMEEMVLLRIDTEARDLREVRCRGEVEDVYVVKDVVSVEPAKNEEPRV